jgi:Mg/Co/Ni transporter MgtE
MFGGLGAASIISGFQGALLNFPILLIFIPLIQATAGNVGVQSSAIVVQGLANDTIKGEILKRLLKEFLLGLVNGIAIAIVVLLISHFFFHTTYLGDQLGGRDRHRDGRPAVEAAVEAGESVDHLEAVVAGPVGRDESEEVGVGLHRSTVAVPTTLHEAGARPVRGRPGTGSSR